MALAGVISAGAHAEIVDPNLVNRIETTEDAVRAEVLLDGGPAEDEAIREAIERAGATVIDVYRDYDRVGVEVAAEAEAEAVAALPWVRVIRTASEPQPQGHGGGTGAEDSDSVISRAAQALRHETWLSGDNPIADGRGIEVGIMSMSFAAAEGPRVDEDTTGVVGCEPGEEEDVGVGECADAPADVEGMAPQRSGDLPGAVRLLSDRDSDSDEGAAMGEIIHDLAPGADLVFHSVELYGGGIGKGVEAVESICNDGVDVFVDNIVFGGEPMYQPGSLMQAFEDECLAEGVPVVRSVGNDGDGGVRSELNLDDEGWHVWDNGTRYLKFEQPPSSSQMMELHWNQPALSVPTNDEHGPQIDLRLVVYDEPGGEVIGESDRDQKADDPDAGQDPLEEVGVNVSGSAEEGTAYVAVEHVAGPSDTIPQDGATPVEFTLWARTNFGENGDFADEGASPWNGAVSGARRATEPGLMSVGGMGWYETGAFDFAQGETDERDMMDYSSRGGESPIPFARDGTLRDPGAADQEIQAPTLTSVTGLNNSFFGGDARTVLDGEPDDHPNFHGTSAAAPVVAAQIAAIQDLTVERLSPVEIEELLVEAAEKRPINGFRGDEAVTGAGLLRTDNIELPWSPVEGGLDDFGPYEVGETVTLSVSPERGTRPYEYEWLHTVGDDLDLEDTDSPQLEFEAEETGRHEFEVRVTDDAGEGHTVAMTASVEIQEEVERDDGSDEDGADDEDSGDTDDSGGGGGSSGGGGAIGVPLLLALLGAGVVHRGRMGRPGV